VSASADVEQWYGCVTCIPGVYCSSKREGTANRASSEVIAVALLQTASPDMDPTGWMVL
jgi:hypothetical protein